MAPKPTPMMTAPTTKEMFGTGENRNVTRPRKSPSHAPLAAPATAARAEVSFPVTRAPLVSSLPTMLTCVTWKSASASVTTAFWASSYVS